MIRYLIALQGILLIGGVSISSPAQAQQMCGERSEALVRLENGYSEVPAAMGLASNGSVVEVFASESGTFTIIITQPNGISCMMVSGESWEDLPAQLAGAKS